MEEFRKKGEAEAGQQGEARHGEQCADADLRTQYQKKDRLEATTRCRSRPTTSRGKQVDYDFNANQGPVVKVMVEGVKLSKSRLKLLVPVYEEGTIDNDLLNEGAFNIKDYLFQQGYFDATVDGEGDGRGHAVGERGVHGGQGRRSTRWRR